MHHWSIFIALAIAGCGSSPPPTCSAAETPYDICSDDQIWECPAASEADLAEKQALVDGCDGAEDSVQCIFELDFEMFPTTLKADCEAGGQICIDDPMLATSGTVCEDP